MLALRISGGWPPWRAVSPARLNGCCGLDDGGTPPVVLVSRGVSMTTEQRHDTSAGSASSIKREVQSVGCNNVLR